MFLATWASGNFKPSSSPLSFLLPYQLLTVLEQEFGSVLGQLLFLDWIPDNGLDHFGVRAGEVFFFVDANYFVAAVLNEFM